MTQSWNDPNTPLSTHDTASSKADDAKLEGRKVAETTRDQANQVKDTAAEQAGAVKDTVADQAGQVRDVAAAHASDLKDGAVDAGHQVAETAKFEATNVVAEAGDQIRTLLDTVTGEARSRAADAQLAATGTLESLTDELGRISRGEATNGPVAQFVGQAHQRGQGLTTWLQSHEPEDVVVEVRRFAARRPVAFLALAAGAGVLAGRLARGAKDVASDQQEITTYRRATQPTRVVTTESHVTSGPGYTQQNSGLGYGDQNTGYGHADQNTGVGYVTEGYVHTEPTGYRTEATGYGDPQLGQADGRYGEGTQLR